MTHAPVGQIVMVFVGLLVVVGQVRRDLRWNKRK